MTPSPVQKKIPGTNAWFHLNTQVVIAGWEDNIKMGLKETDRMVCELESLGSGLGPVQGSLMGMTMKLQTYKKQGVS
jgi:hypothetical protein